MKFKKGERSSPKTEFKKGIIPCIKGRKRSEESIKKQKETIKNRSEEEKRITRKSNRNQES